MSWAKYDDALPQNRKVSWLRAQGVNGIAALGLHLLLNTWSRHEGMQGFIPAYVPEQLAGRHSVKLVKLLADDGCAMLNTVENGWMINDYDDYGDRDDGTPVDEKRARLSKVRAEAGRAGGLSKAARSSSKSSPLPDSKPPSKAKQSSSPVPVPLPKTVNSPTSAGSGNAPAGFAASIVRAYVESAKSVGVATPEESQARVERSARSLLSQGYVPADIENAARNAAAGGWTDLATQIQRDTSRASPTTNGTESTADRRFNDGLALAARLQEPDRKALG